MVTSRSASVKGGQLLPVQQRWIMVSVRGSPRDIRHGRQRDPSSGAQQEQVDVPPVEVRAQPGNTKQAKGCFSRQQGREQRHLRLFVYVQDQVIRERADHPER
ncbi:hypothetical protein [Kutzneria sp. NPDC051319]|uniref:hypothetical protein n=1 Tax=Kutzneria sp. NPDC051319 TaxID=3155047 RepID=UPI003417256B